MFRTIRARLFRRGAKGVFISYRRTDSKPTAVDLSERLRGKLGGEDVFFDADSIPLGQQYPRVIEAGIRSAQVVLVLIGKTWHETKDQHGELRLHQKADVVRREIEQAVEENKIVIPVLIDGAELCPDDPRLPESLRFIGTQNGVILTLDTQQNKYKELDALIDALSPHGVSVSWRRWFWKNRAELAFGVTLLSLIGGAWLTGIPQGLLAEKAHCRQQMWQWLCCIYRCSARPS